MMSLLWAGATTIGKGAAVGVMGVVNQKTLTRMSGVPSYPQIGVGTTFGFEPTSMTAEGPVFSGYGYDVTLSKTRGVAPKVSAAAGAPFTTWGEFAKARLPGSGPSVLFNLYGAYSGYQENGLFGAYQAVALNAAMESAQYHWVYGTQGWKGSANGPVKIGPGVKIAGQTITAKTSSLLWRGAGASIAGAIGQQIGTATGIPFAGTLGAYVGAYFGAAPVRATMAHPAAAGGMLAAAGVAAVSYGAYSVVKNFGQAAYQARQANRGVNTDGSMAAFMSQNAMTMRERSVQAIAKSHLNARSALGQEANFMHSPRNYNSRYR